MNTGHTIAEYGDGRCSIVLSTFETQPRRKHAADLKPRPKVTYELYVRRSDGTDPSTRTYTEAAQYDAWTAFRRSVRTAVDERVAQSEREFDDAVARVAAGANGGTPR